MARPNGSSRDLQAAADELGVHYQTAYRWVRAGQLPAQLVNGRYLVRADDIAALRERRESPREPTRPGARRIARQAKALHNALVDGDEIAARTVVTRLTEQGLTVVELIDDVVAPGLRRIGDAWADGTMSVAEEHRAAAIAERILAEVAPNPRGRRRGTALAVTAPGDDHVLPSTMAAIALRSANWRVHHLGGNLPAEEVLAFCAHHPVDVAVISVTTDGADSAAHALAEELRSRGIRVVEGEARRSVSQMLDDVLATTVA